MLQVDAHMEVNMGKELPTKLIVGQRPSDAQHY